ncbi:MAG: hypothetical protein GY906_38430 [bacterium]|nr:hypothetical protein [bacterium]
MIEFLEHPGWKIFSRDLDAIREAGVVNADQMFPTNDQWQFWRGRKQQLDYVLGYPEMVETLVEKLESGDPSLVFTDEEDPTNSLEA